MAAPLSSVLPRFVDVCLENAFSMRFVALSHPKGWWSCPQKRAVASVVRAAVALVVAAPVVVAALVVAALVVGGHPVLSTTLSPDSGAWW